MVPVCVGAMEYQMSMRGVNLAMQNEGLREVNGSVGIMGSD